MQIGILHQFKPGTNPALVVRMALRQFQQADHCAGHTAAEARFNPGQLPLIVQMNGNGQAELKYVDELRIIADPLVKVNHVRITTIDLTPAAELAAEMAHFDHRVRQQAA